jgi:fatty-acyl-CoA synthase
VSRLIDRIRGCASTQRGLRTGLDRTLTSWVGVRERAGLTAGGLAAHGVEPGDTVAILAASAGDVAPLIQAVWMRGAAATMLHQPTGRTRLEEWALETDRVLDVIDARVVVVAAPFEAPPLAGALSRPVVELDDLDGKGPCDPVGCADEDVALLQLSSGSTGEPKAIAITHANLAAHTDALAYRVLPDPSRDVVASWLPLHHDMGMVGCLVIPMALDLDVVHVAPYEFLRNPLIWPELLSVHGATMTAAPNFAYALISRRLARAPDGAYDLSHLRVALNGAEPVDPEAVQAFTEAGARFGLDPSCIVAAYGMAEATLAVSFAQPGTGCGVDWVDPRALEEERRAVPSTASERRPLARLGTPLAHVELKVVDDAGRRLGPREVGEIAVRGEAVTREIRTGAGREAPQDAEGWLLTGDLGYLTELGEVVVCGRSKELIIIGGRNIFPCDVERAAARAEGVRPGGVAAFGLVRGKLPEAVAVVAESRSFEEADAVEGLRRRIVETLQASIGIVPAEVEVVAPGTLPKTSSGKLRRHEVAARRAAA